MFERFYEKKPPPKPPEMPKWTPAPRKRREYEPPKRYQPPDRNIVYGRFKFDDGPSFERRLIDTLTKAIRARNDKKQGWEHDGWY